MVSKAKWKKYGVDVSKYTAAQLVDYNKVAADVLTHTGYNVKQGTEFIKKMRKNPVAKTVNGVKYRNMWRHTIPDRIFQAILRMASDDVKALKADIRAAHARYKKTAPKKTGRISVAAYTRKKTVKAHTRKRSSKKNKR